MHTQLPASSDEDQIQYFFSPSFQCYTSPLFYRSILLELEWVASVVDDCKEAAREIVWKQLFILCGAPPGLSSSKLISPVIVGWKKSSTMNLLAIELLYLAFATALNQFPDFIKTNITAKNREIFSKAQEPNTVHKFVHSVSTRQPISSPFNSSLPQNASSSVANSVRNSVGISPTYNCNDGLTPQSKATRWNDTSCKISGIANSTQDSDVDIFKKLIELQSQKEILDAQPVEIKKRIWDLLHESDQKPQRYASFSNAINMWAQDIVPNMNMISNMHSVVKRLMSSELSHYTNSQNTSKPIDSKHDNQLSWCMPPVEKLQRNSSIGTPKPQLKISQNTNLSSRYLPSLPPLVKKPFNFNNQSNGHQLPPLRFPFSLDKTPELQHPFPIFDSIPQKRKEQLSLEGEPQTKRMKMDFLNS